MENTRHTLVRVQNREGSVEHFYHFSLGYLAPLLLFLENEPPFGGRRYLARRCGPMDAVLAALDLREVVFVEKTRFLSTLARGTHPARACFGVDHPDFYDAALFRRLRAAVFRRLGMVAPATRTRIDLTVVDRGESPPFYQSAAAEAKTSAKLRRSVPNMAEVGAALGRAGWLGSTVQLEQMPFRAQADLFARTRVLVAQHGAALVHMLWMEPGGTVLEIIPRDLAVSRVARHFSALAACCGHRYLQVEQDTAHAPVDPAAVVAALETAGTQGVMG